MNSSVVQTTLANLEEILDAEQRALNGPPSVKLTDIAEEKERILAELTEMAPQTDEKSTFDDNIIARLKRCQEINENNNLLVNQRLKVMRDASQIVRQQSSYQSVALYDGGGRLVQATGSKSLSEA